MSTFSVELTIKIAGREVTPDQFVETMVAKVIEGLRREIEGLRNVQLPTPRFAVTERDKQPRAVGINRAAELLGISPWTIRSYVSRGKLHSNWGREQNSDSDGDP